MENNDTKWVEHWIDYLKLDMQMDMRKATIYTVWIIALTSGTVFVYSIINNMYEYELDLWQNLYLFLLLVIAIASVIAPEILWSKSRKKIVTQHRTRGLTLFLIVMSLGLLGIGFLGIFFLSKEHFVFILLGLPFYALADCVVVFFNLLLLTFAKVTFKRGMLTKVLGKKGQIDPDKIYENVLFVEKMTLVDVVNMVRVTIKAEKKLLERE